MASADELRSAVEQARQELRAAIEAAAGRWEESPGGEEWAAKRVAEHVVGAERGYAGRVATAMQGRPPERTELQLASAEEALQALEAAGADFSRVVRYVEDRDLKKVPEPGKPDVEAIMRGAADHLREHAEQIRAAAAVPAGD
jgi:uncharacterized damage-inducible protein DinB